MPIRRPKLRIRTLMLVVAVVALFIVGGRWAARMRRRSEDYSKEVAFYAKLEVSSLGTAKQHESQIALHESSIALWESQIADAKAEQKKFEEVMQKLSGKARAESEPYSESLENLIKTFGILLNQSIHHAQECRERAAYFADIRRRYERAARYPWWGEPDLPPEPE